MRPAVVALVAVATLAACAGEGEAPRDAKSGAEVLPARVGGGSAAARPAEGDAAAPRDGETAAPAAVAPASISTHLEAIARIAAQSNGTRAAGTPGETATGDYVAAFLRDAGWQVRFEPVRFRYHELRSARLAVGGRPLRLGRAFQVPAYSGSGRAQGRARRFDPGCHAGAFAGLRRGEIPVAPDGKCLFREQARRAAAAGARAIVIGVHASRRGVMSATLGVPGIRIPVLLVPLRERPAEGARVSLAVRARTRPATTRNVIADLPGDGRVVMAGAHLDSVTAGPGLNDNGSGVAALLEVGERLAEQPPPRPVRLGFWAAEELGLLGSTRHVRSLSPAARRAIAAYINIDMVGSPNPLPSVYGDGDRRLARVLRRALGEHAPGLPAAGASDHAPFARVGVPVNGFYTGSEERRRGRSRDPCYHLACDTLANVDQAVLLRITDATERALRELAQAK